MSAKGNDTPYWSLPSPAAGQGPNQAAAGVPPAGQVQIDTLSDAPALRRHHQGGKRQQKGEELVEAVTIRGTVMMSDTAAKDVLKTVRDRAEGWRNGAAASLALILGSMTIKGPADGIGAFTGQTQGLLVVLLSLSVGLALLSLYKFLRAANGPSWLDASIGQIGRAYDAKRYIRRAGGAAHDLKVGHLLWFAAIAMFFLVNILVWTRARNRSMSALRTGSAVHRRAASASARARPGWAASHAAPAAEASRSERRAAAEVSSDARSHAAEAAS